MPDTYNLLPAFEVLDPAVQWPAEMSEPAVAQVHEQIATYVDRARCRAEELEAIATRPGRRPEPAQRADVLMLVWTARSAVAARNVLNAARAAAQGPYDELMWHAFIAGLTCHTALADPDDAGQELIDDLHRRLEGAAHWCWAAWSATSAPSNPVRLNDYSQGLWDALPPGFQRGGELKPQQVGADPAGRVQSSWRERPDGTLDSIRVYAEYGNIHEIRLTRKGPDGTIVFGPQSLAYPELCLMLARAHAMPAGPR